MAEGTVTKRLGKVARELGVGVGTIADFLNGKGFDVAGNPNTKIGGKEYQLVLEEFQSDKAAQDKSRAMRQTRVERQSISLDETERRESRRKDEQEEILIKNLQNVASPDRVIKPKVDEVRPKVVDKIDLDAVPAGRGRKPKPAAEPEKPAAAPAPAPVEAKAEPKPPTPAAEPAKPEPAKPAAQAPAPPKAAEPAKPAEPKPVEAPQAKAEPAAQAAPAKPAETEAKPSEAEAPAPAAKQEPEIVRATVKPLEGIKVMGKIELPQEKKPKPVASSSDNDLTRARRKKRKRIQKPDARPPQAGPGAGPGNRPGGNRPGQGGRPGQGNRGGNRGPAKPELTEQDIQNQIRETLARLSSSNKSKSAKYRRAKRDAVSQAREKEMQAAAEQKTVLKVTEFVTVNELATMMSVPPTDVISACMSLGLFVSINQRLDAETLSIVAEEFGFTTEFVSEEATSNVSLEEADHDEEVVERPPIVTVMGHVDHGKTSLLDYVRDANVIAGEAGGITQHIGAYSVELENKRRITFLDTPGHEAFTAMRARGAQVTDVVIIVIAADDSVMPQTKEAINHAQAANVPIVFALNKMDLPGANAEKIKEELSQMDILVEDWGGKYQSQEISAKKGTHVDDLLEKVLLEAELLDLKADPSKRAVGTVIESQLDKGRGYVTTMLVEAGTLEVGDVMLAGPYSGRVKAMYNERGNTVDQAGPATPVSILGFNGAPSAGDKFHVLDDEREAKNIANKRLQLIREQGVRTQKHITLDEIGRRLAIGDFQELKIIVKGDVDGSVEALSDSLLKLSTEKIQVNVIGKSVGQITESDVLLASASDAIIVGFQVRPSASSRKLAEREGIDIRTYSVIYDAIDEVRSAMEGMLKPKVEEKVTCNLEVRETFKISKVGTVAGCYVLDGTITRNTKIRLIRDGVVVYTGELGSLKRFKEDVREVKSGYECGLNIQNFNDIKVADQIEGYEEVEVKQTLD